jgi:hypothetical protein
VLLEEENCVIAHVSKNASFDQVSKLSFGLDQKVKMSHAN